MLESDAGVTVGQLVPDYELLKRVGGGAYGEVWLARSKATGFLRAAKIVWRRTFEDERPYQREFEGIQRFERISREHPSQLALFHIGRNEAEGYFYYVMELADNVGTDSDYSPRTLRAELKDGRLPAQRLVEIGLALAEALEHLHKNGLVHRDVKPSNVIFVNGQPKLADIGLVTDASDSCSIVGTEGYLAPEGPGTPQADIFALGKVLYEAATGMDRREFPKLPLDLRTWPDARLVFELNEIYLQACATNPQRRYADANSVLKELTVLQRGRSVRSKRARKQQLAIAKAVVLAAVLTGGGALLWRQAHREQPVSTNFEAEKLYWRAIYQIERRTLAPLQTAYTNLSEAVKLDPRFVDAYYQIFELYMGSLGGRLPPYYNQYTNFLMATKSLHAIAPNSVQYHTANSMVKFLDWKFNDAIEEVKLAIKINPKFMRAHGFYGFYALLGQADTVTALEQFRIAERLDKVDTTIQSSLGRPFYVGRKFDVAISYFKKALDLEPQEAAGHLNLARAYEAAKQYTNALNEYWALELLNTADPRKTNARFEKQLTDLHDKGPRGWYEGLLEEARRERNPSPYFMATLCARLDKTDEAIQLLNLAYAQHSSGMVHLIEEECWDPFRTEQWFRDLVEKVGFPPKAQVPKN